MNLNRRAARLGLLLLIPLLLAQQAKAEDDADGVMLSGLHAIPAGSVRVASSSITIRQGTIYLSVTTRAEDTAAAITVEGPQFKWLGEQDPYPDRQFPELKINVDHVPVKLQDHSTASFRRKDITGELKEAGIDLFTVSQSPPVLFSTPQNLAVFNQLLAMGAIAPLGGQDVAAWSARRDVSFSLGEGAHLVTLQYTARPAINLLPPAQLPKALPLAAYCLSDATLRRAVVWAAKSGHVLAVQYSIPVGIDGETGGAVTVDLADPGGASLPAAEAFFCGPDGKPVTAANRAAHTPAKPDASGVVHILTLGSAVTG
jgi:hypothetical protein